MTFFLPKPIRKLSLRRYLRLRQYALRYLDIQIAVLACSLLSGAGGMLGPYLAKLTFDYAYANRDWPLLLVLAASGFLVMLLSQAGINAQQYLQLYASQHLTFALRADFLRHLYSLPLSFFQRRSTGEHVYRLNADIPAASNFLGGLVSNAISPFISAAYPLIGIVLLDWRFALIAAAATPIFVAQSHYFGRRQRELTSILAAEGQRISSEATDRIAQIKLVKAFGRERKEIREYLSNQIRLVRLAFRGYRLNLWSSTSCNIINSLGQGLLGLYLGYRVVVVADMKVGTLVALSMYALQLFGAASKLAGLYQNMLSQLVPVDRVLDILEEDSCIQESEKAVSPGPLQGALALRKVSFGYTPGKPVLRGTNLDIAPGSFVAIVGASGVGKTTILNLFLRLYDPDDGEVLVDGKPLRDLKLAPFRSQVGIGLQETFMFNATVRENILYGNADATPDEVREAARQADADEFINALPQGYETKVGEAGCMLSAGQRQRIGIARALVRHPHILFLDEATASLSSTSEADILQAIRSCNRECTLIVVTHRLSAIREADRIFVLGEGRVMEEGAHAELVAQCGLYSTAWDSQFGPKGRVAGVTAAEER